MNELKVFAHSQFGEVRTVVREGEPWFVAADVCKALEHSNPSMAVKGLDEDERMTLNFAEAQSDEGMTLNFDSPRQTGKAGGAQSVVIISEAGLYQLIIRSNKPEARAFKRWITHDVIPAIRKTGGYIAGEESMTDEELLSRALLMATAKIKERDERIGQLSADNSRLAVQTQIMAPKADYFDQLVDRNLLTNFRDTAKSLG